VGYSSSEFDANRRATFRAGVAQLIPEITANEVHIRSVADVIAKRKRHLLQSRIPVIDVDYSVFVESSSAVTLMDVSAALKTGDLEQTLRTAGMTSLTSVSTTVLDLLLPPPPSPPPIPPTPAVSNPPQNSTLSGVPVADDEDPDFSTARFVGLFAGGAAMLLLSLAYRYRRNAVEHVSGIVSRVRPIRREDKVKDPIDDDAPSAADEFIASVCK
jgi:hypothetical protein